LIGPMAESDREEELRAAAHGLTVWGLCVTATAILVLISGWVVAGSSAVAQGLSISAANSADPAPAVVSYWTDVLFRPAPMPMHASLPWQQYAQAGNTASDASPATLDDENPSSTAPAAKPMTAVPNNTGRVENDTGQVPAPASPSTQPQSAPPAAPHVITIPAEGESTPSPTPGAPPPAAARNLPADKAEVGRILAASWANGGTISSYDRDRVAELVSQEVGVTPAEAARRVDNAEAQMRRDEMRLAEAARKIARNASLWIALALLFGAVVAIMAAISARWEDDRITFGFRRSEPV
ncbi:MAG: hypothetical protein JOY77_07750, partial [Alphaproteobacteria bacterium]|nr:hypothetical protein [Alphaproteobacteria bacterium]